MADTHLWIRAEARTDERRAPLTPPAVAELVGRGVEVTVERSDTRIFPTEEYAAAGAHLADAGGWHEAPDSAYVLGIKELPEEPGDLRHAHIYFAHAFKGQDGAAELLDRFRRGGGELLDVEYLTVQGRRVVAFGYWAGYVGAALSVLLARGRLEAPVRPGTREDLDAAIAAHADEPTLSGLVIGARGRSGTGARDALAVAGVDITGWDVDHTRHLDHPALLAHDLLVNCVVAHGPGDAFVREQDVTDTGRALRVVGDVTCDVTGPANRIPVNTAITTWDQPARRLSDDPVLDVIAIDNLPSLLPLEASESFSAQLLPLIEDLPARTGAWAEAEAAYERASGAQPPR